MKKNLLLYCFSGLLLSALPVQGQEQDSAFILLREVQVETIRIKSRTGFKKTQIDSATIQRYENTNLGQLLQQQSSLFIRSYGLSGQSSPSIRGTGASHTQVYWNGLLINSPTLGQTDLTTLPVAISDEISINYGGASLLDGSGGLGGSINLNSYNKENQLRLNTSLNSIGNLSGNLLYAYGKNRLRGSTKVVWLENRNRFSYTSLAGEKELMENARHRGRSLVQTFSYRLRPSENLNFSSWYQQDTREIQPSLFVNLYDEQLQEEFWRNSLSYELNKADYRLNITGGWFYNKLPRTERAGEEAPATGHTDTYQTKARYFRKLKKGLYLRSGLDAMHNQAVAEAFSGTKDQQRLGFLAGIEATIYKGLSADALLRSEWVSERGGTKLLPSLALHYEFSPAWSLSLNGSYNYRILSLNEQYWASYARRNLVPEESRNLELLVQQEGENNVFEWNQQLSLFSYWVENWIIWVPGMPSWKPENASEVHNRGFEYTFTAGSAGMGDWRWEGEGSYNFTRATNLSEFRGNKEAIGKQLIFTPVHKASLQGQLHYKKWHLFLNELYTGKRFSRSDETEYLPSFLLTNIGLGYRFSLNKNILSARLSAQNLFNYHYQVIPFYAMPGRVWGLSFTYKLDL